MGVLRRRGHVAVAEQRPRDQQRVAAGRAHRGEAVPQVMQAHVIEPGGVAHRVPDAAQVREVLAGLHPREDEGAAGEGGQRVQDLGGRGAQGPDTLPGLRVRVPGFRRFTGAGGSPVRSAVARASPSVATSAAVRKRSRPCSGYGFTARTGLLWRGRAPSSSAKVKKAPRRLRTRFA